MIKACIKTVLWAVLFIYLIGLHFMSVTHISWMITEEKKMSDMDKKIKSGYYVVKHKKTKGKSRFYYPSVR